jgi:hypothetical protein
MWLQTAMSKESSSNRVECVHHLEPNVGEALMSLAVCDGARVDVNADHVTHMLAENVGHEARRKRGAGGAPPHQVFQVVPQDSQDLASFRSRTSPRYISLEVPASPVKLVW